jgi:serine/threonine protein kinase
VRGRGFLLFFVLFLNIFVFHASQELNRLKPICEDNDLIDEKNVYRVFDGLGLGQFATVVKVEDMGTKMIYAMKVTSKSRMLKQKERDQLAVELEVMIVTKGFPFLQGCHHAFETATNVVFVNDFIGGGDLFYHLGKRYKSLDAITNGFKESEVKIMLAEVFLALEHMHNHHFIHRDVKIENIVVDVNGHLKLVDFGLAMEMSSSSDVQVMDRFGSLTSMSPELINHQTGGRHTDWWALGVLAYELFTGNTPWSDMTDTKLICIEIISKKVNPPNFLSKGACKFVNGLLSKDYRVRLGTKQDAEIRSCLFFKHINWNKMLRLEHQPAFVPSADINVDMEDRKASVNAFGDMCNKHNTKEKTIVSVKDAVRILYG